MSCLFWGKWAVEQGEAVPVRSSSTAVPNTPERAGEPRQAFSNWPTERRLPEANRPSGCTWSTSGWSTSVASQGQPSARAAGEGSDASCEKLLLPGDQRIIWDTQTKSVREGPKIWGEKLLEARELTACLSRIGGLWALIFGCYCKFDLISQP